MKPLAPEGAVRFKSKYVILCEGKYDRDFLGSYVNPQSGQKNAPQFDIVTCEDACGTGGTSGWEQSLRAFAANPTFRDVRGLIIVADNDDEPTSRFQAVTAAISTVMAAPDTAAKRFVVPSGPQKIATTADLAVAIVMVPLNSQYGAMENLVAEAALTAVKPETMNCVNTFLNCASLQHLNTAQKAKITVRAIFLALGCVNPTFAKVGGGRCPSWPQNLTSPDISTLVGFINAFPNQCP